MKAPVEAPFCRICGSELVRSQGTKWEHDPQTNRGIQWTLWACWSCNGRYETGVDAT